jgi:methylornithine synthase
MRDGRLMNEMKDSNNRLAKILDKARREEILDGSEIVFLLSLTQKSQIDAVLEAARDLRLRHFGNRIFLYGFVYISTFCRNQCNFCYFRKTNELPVRYRREASEVVEAAQSLAESGVHLIDLTLGEDPQYFYEQGFEPLVELVEAVRKATDLPVMVSPGVVPADVLSDFAQAGATWYACYQETHNRELFKKLRPGQRYDARLETKERAVPLGLLTEEGLLRGVGESARDIADSIEAMRSLEVSQVRAMSFVPQKGTPLQSWKEAGPLLEIMTIAVLRLVFPDRLIPATLDVEGLTGLQSRLEAGANVVTSLVPPGFGLAGVAQNSLDIADARRTIASIVPEMEKLGLQTASLGDYLNWIEDRRRQIRSGLASPQPSLGQLGG